jgi:4-hydroxythreonine-4-phosphate dehydrogenase
MNPPASKPRIALALGDPGGISYAVAARVLPEFSSQADIRLFGDFDHFRRQAALIGAAIPAGLRGENLPGAGSYSPAPSPANGELALRSLEAALAAVRRGDADLLVTAPLSKGAVRHHLPEFRGHTEFLQEKTGGQAVLMTFFTEKFKVALHTTHIPLREVWDSLTVPRLVDGLTRLDGEWRKLFNAPPRIGLAGLNPHAGENGAFGREEIDILMPAAAAARGAGINVSNPLPPDTLTRQRGFDIFYALYHDQGLIAAKALPEEAAHVTLGLPFIRTSPDHGVAYDLAATPEKASPEGMRAALRWAIRLFES